MPIVCFLIFVSEFRAHTRPLSYTPVRLHSRCVFRGVQRQYNTYSHRSDVGHVYRRATALSSCLFYVLQSELALRQLLRFDLRYSLISISVRLDLTRAHNRHFPLRTFTLDFEFAANFSLASTISPIGSTSLLFRWSSWALWFISVIPPV